MASQAQHSIQQYFKFQLTETNKEKFASLLKWCQENGLLNSFEEIASAHSDEKQYSKESIAFFDDMLEQGEREIAEGKGFTSEEASAKL